jgi:hypothetical protein
MMCKALDQGQRWDRRERRERRERKKVCWQRDSSLKADQT